MVYFSLLSASSRVYWQLGKQKETDRQTWVDKLTLLRGTVQKKLTVCRVIRLEETWRDVGSEKEYKSDCTWLVGWLGNNKSARKEKDSISSSSRWVLWNMRRLLNGWLTPVGRTVGKHGAAAVVQHGGVWDDLNGRMFQFRWTTVLFLLHLGLESTAYSQSSNGNSLQHPFVLVRSVDSVGYGIDKSRSKDM